jgi:prepilin-type N-terminal cleavage/methylation domain-containing protein
MRKAFTLIEVVVSLGILAVILSFAGVIFRVSIDAQRMAMANAEIMQKLRVITEQLDADFQGLCKDGEILVFWKVARKPNFVGVNPNDPNAFERFDTIMFFATGDFYTYDATSPQRSNVARICYTLASVGFADPNRPLTQKPEKRMLVRTQHILTPPPNGIDANDPLGMRSFTDDQWRDWNSNGQADAISMQGWLLMDDAVKADIISVIADVEVSGGSGGPASALNRTAGGVRLDPAQPASMHPLLCEGVGQFKVQGWWGDPDAPNPTEPRWIPEVNPDGDADLTDDSDFLLSGADLDPVNIPGLRYPRGPLIMRNQSPVVDPDIRKVPGLGRALKFTFTLYDSRGLIRNGRTFTHIVTLDD